MKKNKFIVFEGIDGSGKSTIVNKLYDFIKDKSLPVVKLYEPTKESSYGKKIRELARENISIDINLELNYFIEDRKFNVQENIIPALKRGDWVVQDRYYYSTAAYQGARGFDIQKILKDNEVFAPMPDIVFFFDLDINIALERIDKERNAKDLLFENQEYLRSVRNNFLNIAKLYSNIVVIDSSSAVEKVFDEVLSYL